MKLPQFGGSSSFFKSIKLARGGNHESVVRLRCLPFAEAILDCCGDGVMRRSEEKGSTFMSPLETIARTWMLLALTTDNLRSAPLSIDGRREAARESSSSSSLMLMKFE